MPTDPPPLVRARFCQEWLTFIDTEDEPFRSRFAALLDPALKETIVSAARVAWLPIDVHVKLADTTHEAFGAVRAHDYYRRALGASIRGPVLGPLLQTAARLLGISVPTFVRWSSRAWEAVFHNAGVLTGEVLGPDRATITYTGLPAVCTASDPWMASAQGSVYGAFDLLGVEGVVRVDMSKRSEGGMKLELVWTPRGADKKEPEFPV